MFVKCTRVGNKIGYILSTGWNRKLCTRPEALAMATEKDVRKAETGLLDFAQPTLGMEETGSD